MQPIYDESFDIRLQDVVVEPRSAAYHPVKLITGQDSTYCRYYPVKNAEKAVIWVGGAGGGWDTPASGLYPRLCEDLTSEAIASLRIRYRYPAQLTDSVLDVLTGLTYLRDQGIKYLALVGHSFGGAVVIQAAAQSPDVYAAVALATQTSGINDVTKLAPRCSLLLLHGMVDQVLPPICSQQVYQQALQPKQIILYPHANHGLNEVAAQVYHVVRDWIIQKLNRSSVT
ncbi:MAG TPA: dienelactone hydrolase family protein [Nodularia sp. (in: cyanobacteria)]|nr:dienelactone hydrolase family protein [Nodularia sp. (in: cyanobacteria)]